MKFIFISDVTTDEISFLDVSKSNLFIFLLFFTFENILNSFIRCYVAFFLALKKGNCLSNIFKKWPFLSLDKSRQEYSLSNYPFIYIQLVPFSNFERNKSNAIIVSIYTIHQFCQSNPNLLFLTLSSFKIFVFKFSKLATYSRFINTNAFLANLQANDKVELYTFRLEVADRKRQNDSTTVDILVNKAVSSAPSIVFVIQDFFP